MFLGVALEHEKDPFGKEERKGFAIFPRSKALRHYPAVFFRFDGNVIQKTQLAGVDSAFPFVQPLPNDEILVVVARCHYQNGKPEKNATVYGPDGKIRKQFVLGDGINAVQTTSDGLIWVSYFDEGVFGNFGWDKPFGSAGLVCFDTAGQVVWEFRPPEGVDTIADCYAVNVAKEAVWACYYTEFPIVRIDSQKRVCAWANTIGGANAIVVDHVFCYGAAMATTAVDAWCRRLKGKRSMGFRNCHCHCLMGLTQPRSISLDETQSCMGSRVTSGSRST